MKILATNIKIKMFFSQIMFIIDRTNLYRKTPLVFRYSINYIFVIESYNQKTKQTA